MRKDAVWSSLLDRRYTVRVIRTESYSGQLIISYSGQILHREPVSLSYNALFGPDIEDVAHWKQLAVAFVDRLNRL